jgi:tRNA (guanine-N7-)-methyltransferase
MKKVRKRLTSTRFMQLYRTVLADGGRINLKSDSPFLYNYTRQMCLANPAAINIVTDTADLYANPGTAGSILDIRTHYEQQWLDRGLTIKYLAFDLDANTPLTEIDDSDIERDTYRSYSRGQLECPQLLDNDNND